MNTWVDILRGLLCQNRLSRLSLDIECCGAAWWRVAGFLGYLFSLRFYQGNWGCFITLENNRKYIFTWEKHQWIESELFIPIFYQFDLTISTYEFLVTNLCFLIVVDGHHKAINMTFHVLQNEKASMKLHVQRIGMNKTRHIHLRFAHMSEGEKALSLVDWFQVIHIFFSQSEVKDLKRSKEIMQSRGNQLPKSITLN